MKKWMFTLLCFSFLNFAFAQKKDAYTIYNNKGQKVSYSKMLKASSKAKVILFGEFHDNAISHWLQLELSKDLSAKKSITFGAEMFETDNQQQVTDYVTGKIDAETLDSTARLWKNFKTDYQPLLDAAKENKFEFIATNVPRQYAKMVYLEGFDTLTTLSIEEKNWIAPLPIKYDATLPQYRKMLEMMGGHGGENLPKAQALKDATMAYNIYKNISKSDIFLHFNGSYHSNYYEGIYWYLKQKADDLKITTITTVSQSNIYKLLEENKGAADFIIVVDEDMTPTYK